MTNSEKDAAHLERLKPYKDQVIRCVGKWYFQHTEGGDPRMKQWAEEELSKAFKRLSVAALNGGK